MYSSILSFISSFNGLNDYFMETSVRIKSIILRNWKSILNEIFMSRIFSGKLLMKDCYCYLWYSVISGDDGEVWGWGEEGGWWWTGAQESIKAGLQTFWHRRLYPFQKDVDFILSAFMMEFFWFSLRDACAHWSRNSPPYCSRFCCLSAQSGRAGQGKSQIWLITL